MSSMRTDPAGAAEPGGIRGRWNQWRAWWREPHFLEKASGIGVAVVLLQLVMLPPKEPLQMLCALGGFAVLVALRFAPRAICWCGLALCLATAYAARGAFGINYAVVVIMFLAVGYDMPPMVALAVPIVYALADVAGFVLFGAASGGGEFVRGMLNAIRDIDAEGVIGPHAGDSVPAHSPLVFIGAVMLEVMFFGFLTIVGRAFRRTTQTTDRLARAERMLGRITREQELAHMIHDSVANDMSTIAMLAWRAKTVDDDAGMLDRIYACSHHALDRVHEVIDVLNGKRDLDDVAYGGIPRDEPALRAMPGDALGAGSDMPLSFTARLEKYVEDQDRTMAMLGIHGVSRLNGVPGADVPQPVRYATMNLIEEIYANIVRHCAIGYPVGASAAGGRGSDGSCLDAETGTGRDSGVGADPLYSLFVDVLVDRIRVHEVNDLAEESATMVYGHGAGSGLALHRAAIEALGGTLNASAQDGAWTISAEIPW